MQYKDDIKILSDHDLIAQYRRDGHMFCMEELYRRYGFLIYGICLQILRNAEDARECTMISFEKAISELRKTEVSNVGPWLHSVARNQCLMFLRGEKRRAERQARYAASSEATDNELERFELGDEKASLISRAMHVLSEPQRKCVELFYFKEKSYKEVAESTGFGLEEVKSNLQNARRNLKLFFGRA